VADLAVEVIRAYDGHVLRALRALHHPDADVTFGGSDPTTPCPSTSGWAPSPASGASSLTSTSRSSRWIVDGLVAALDLELHGTNTEDIDLDPGSRQLLRTDATTLVATGLRVGTAGVVFLHTDAGAVVRELHHWQEAWLYRALGLVHLVPVASAGQPTSARPSVAELPAGPGCGAHHLRMKRREAP
jgi:hypothetical protein